MENQKLWYTSKILWVNVIGLIVMIVQGVKGFVISPEVQASILLLINIILRAVTKQEIVWGKAKKV